jgi:hypothetical protein
MFFNKSLFMIAATESPVVIINDVGTGGCNP